MANVLRITAVSEPITTNGKTFKKVSFAQHGTQQVDGIAVISDAKPRTRNVFATTYDGQPNPLYDQLKVGSGVLGTIETDAVEPYEITNPETGEVKTVNMYTCVKYQSESLNSAFKAAGRPLAGSAIQAPVEAEEAL